MGGSRLAFGRVRSPRSRGLSERLGSRCPRCHVHHSSFLGASFRLSADHALPPYTDPTSFAFPSSITGSSYASTGSGRRLRSISGSRRADEKCPGTDRDEGEPVSPYANLHACNCLSYEAGDHTNGDMQKLSQQLRLAPAHSGRPRSVACAEEQVRRAGTPPIYQADGSMPIPMLHQTSNGS